MEIARVCSVPSVFAMVALLAAVPAQAATDVDTFEVEIDILATCTVTAGTASDIDLGDHISTVTTAAGNNDITVNCSKTTPYFIGLAPSNSSTAGLGAMDATGASTDEVPYQLRSATGAAGAVWGNTATNLVVGNGVAGTGIGADQTHTVYVTAPDLNFAPDNYVDTVTITVNY